MASRKLVLTVHYSRKAEKQLDEIYEFNIEKRGLTAADGYITFLRTKIASLATERDAGNPIEERPGLRYMLLKQRTGKWKDGHIVVYEIVEATNTVEVWFIFHTKQDWENKL